MGEELRVLYVAMTRAKEKLIMTGTDRYLNKKLERYQDIPRIGRQIPFTILSAGDSYLDWIIMSLSGVLSDVKILTENGQEMKHLIVKEYSIPQLIGREVERQAQKRVTKEELLRLDVDKTYDAEYAKGLQEAFAYVYPYLSEIGLHTKLSVSEIKKQGQMIDDEESAFLPTIPQFLQKEEEEESVGGAFRGTAYHRVLELLDFASVTTFEEVEAALRRFGDERRMDQESLSLLNPKTILGFLTSPLGKRMAKAEKEGRLHKEQQFVIGIPAREMDISDSQELVLIQGIIDAYMEEDGKLVIVDYKTDRVGNGQEQILIDRYHVQLEYYKRALEQMTGKTVSEKIIYSVALQKEICL
jgi:ATP-dependent helicase/nuclease subunit A